MTNLTKELEKAIKEMKCYNCGEPTDRFIKFATVIGIVYDYECLKCRQERVQRQVDEGLRPASDLDTLPEDKNPL